MSSIYESACEQAVSLCSAYLEIVSERSLYWTSRSPLEDQVRNELLLRLRHLHMRPTGQSEWTYVLNDSWVRDAWDVLSEIDIAVEGSGEDQKHGGWIFSPALCAKMEFRSMIEAVRSYSPSFS